MPENTAPGLLIAMPTLLDPNFFRSVVLMCAHTDEGAFGLVINRATEVTTAKVCAESDISWTGDQESIAFCGGPVEPQRGWLLHSDDVTYPGSQLVAAGVAISASQEALEAYGNAPAARFRLILGYAGWGPGQLEEELTQGAWLTAPADPELVFHSNTTRLWDLVLRSVGVDPTHLVGGSSTLN